MFVGDRFMELLRNVLRRIFGNYVQGCDYVIAVFAAVLFIMFVLASRLKLDLRLTKYWKLLIYY